MSGAQAVVESLGREGVEVVFGLPGVQIMHLFDAFYGHSDIRLVTVRHEQAATYMADGYARVTGKPGVALVVPGPGVQNASAGLGTAYASSSPVLLVAGQVDSPSLGKDRGALHEINDQLDVVRPVTKWCHRVLRVQEIPEAIHEAMHQMRSGRPRPTVVELPPDVLADSAEVGLMESEEYPPRSPDGEKVRQAVDLLLKARRPLIWAGGGANTSGAAAELAALAEALKVPVALTPEGKGALPDDHPYSLGASYYGHGAAAQAMPRADVVLAVGTRITGFMRGPTALREPQRLVHIDVDEREFGKNYPPTVALHADAARALQALRREVLSRGAGVPERWPPQELERLREDTRRWLRDQAPTQMDIINALRRELDEDAIIVSGVTNVGYWCNFGLNVRRPRTYFTSSYFATLGYAFPLSLGVKLAAPERPVVCLAGDGGFTYAVGELATAVQYNINVVILVFNDGAFGASLADQRTRYGGREIGTQFHNPDFVGLAEAFGARGMKLSGPEDVGPALRDALNGERPTVIEVPLPTLMPPFQISPEEVT